MLSITVDIVNIVANLSFTNKKGLSELAALKGL